MIAGANVQTIGECETDDAFWRIYERYFFSGLLLLTSRTRSSEVSKCGRCCCCCCYAGADTGAYIARLFVHVQTEKTAERYTPNPLQSREFIFCCRHFILVILNRLNFRPSHVCCLVAYSIYSIYDTFEWVFVYRQLTHFPDMLFGPPYVCDLLCEKHICKFRNEHLVKRLHIFQVFLIMHLPLSIVVKLSACALCLYKFVKFDGTTEYWYLHTIHIQQPFTL